MGKFAPLSTRQRLQLLGYFWLTAALFYLLVVLLWHPDVTIAFLAYGVFVVVSVIVIWKWLPRQGA